MSQRVRLHVGPAPSSVVKGWVENRQRLVDVARTAPTMSAHEEVLELLDTILGLWTAAADGSEVFEWSYEMEPDVLLLIARYWLDLGQLTAEERAEMGAPLASPEVEAFTVDVVRGMVDALRQTGEPGRELLARLGL